LGNQLAIVLTNKISDAVSAGTLNSKLLPKRVALLDPFYSNYAKSYLGNKWVGKVSRTYVSALKTKGVISEAYRTSSATSTAFVSGANTDLMKMTTFSELKPWPFNSVQHVEKHNAAVWHSLWYFSSNPSLITGTSNQAASAKTSDSRINTLMSGSKKLGLDQGAYTKEPSDDNFKEANR
jgi:hypothetical protein